MWLALQSLLKAGLKRQAAAALLKTYAGAASQNALQLSLTDQTTAAQYDATLAAA